MSCLYRLSFVALTLLSASASADWTYESGNAQVALVELYTSQGCSSCPPADRWLSTFKDRGDLWSAVVPVAWHVTYWDYLGWRDPFGRRENDQRQRRMAAAAASGVYTPGMFLNRGEYRYWRGVPATAVSAGDRAVGRLQASSDGQRISIRFEPAEAIQLESPSVELVYLRTDRKTDVERGENRGRQLQHDFVAGDLTRVRFDSDGNAWTATIRKTPDDNAVAVALWVLDQRGHYLQATGGWL